MKKWMITGMALLATTALAAETRVLCDENGESCQTIRGLRLAGDAVQVLYLGDGDQEPGFVPLRAFAARRGYLGVSLTELTPELRTHFGVPDDEGVLVSRVEKDSPAARGGIQVGDIITRADDEPLTSATSLKLMIRRRAEGDGIELEVWRDGRPSTLQVTLAETERAHYDLSGLTTPEALLALGGGQAIPGLEALENLRILGGQDGRYIFRFDSDLARQYADAWKTYVENLPRSLSSMTLLEDNLQQRIDELEEKLRELEEEIQSGSSDR
jgi:hypothetical protein